MLISYEPNNLYPELSKIVFKNYSNNLSATFYSIIFSTNAEDKKDCMEISEHIIEKDGLNQNIFNSLYHTFLEAFLCNFSESFDPFKLYEPFEFEFELELKHSSKKPQILKRSHKNSIEKRELYIDTVIVKDQEFYRIAFKNIEGKYSTQTLNKQNFTLEEAVEIRNKMIVEKGLVKNSKNCELFGESKNSREPKKRSLHKKSYGTSGQLYINEGVVNGNKVWRIIFKNKVGKFTSKQLPHEKYTLEQIIEIRDKMIVEKGLWCTSVEIDV